jgi:hypothetical protein
VATVQAFFGSALRAAAAGLPANDFVKLLQAEGLGTRRSTVLQLYKVAKGLTVAAEGEPYANQHEVPYGSALGQWPTKKAAGIRQNVKIVYRDRTTGDYKTVPYSTITANGMTRQAAIAAAIDSYADNAERYNQDLVGAFHSSAQLMIPDTTP